MKLSSYLSESLIINNIVGKNIEELAENLLSQIIKNNPSLKLDKKRIADAISKREAEGSTYMGYGIAIPHARLENFNDILVAIGFLKAPITIKDLSGKEEELKVIILILADVLKSKKILKIMSGISKLAIKNEKILNKILEEKSSSYTIKILEKSNIEIDKNITAEDLFTCLPEPAHIENTLEDIAKRIIIEGVSGIPVVDNDNLFLGEITERELISFGMPKYTSILDNLNFMTVGEPFENYLVNEKTTKIKDLYRKEGVIFVDKEASLMEISYLFMTKGVTRIYVVENKKYIGVIKRSDIIKKILHI